MIDAWLLSRWRSKGRPAIRYVPTLSLKEETNSAAEISRYRSAFDLPEEGPCEVCDLITVLHVGGNHYCCLVILPTAHVIHVLGRRFTVNISVENATNWKEWNGPNVWEKVKQLHGWTDDQAMKVNTDDWNQNGTDCGLTACQVVESIWEDETTITNTTLWRKPWFPCCHSKRLVLANFVITNAIERFADYERAMAWPEAAAAVQSSYALEGWAHLMEGLKNSSSFDDAVLRSIHRDMMACTGCKSSVLEQRPQRDSTLMAQNHQDGAAKEIPEPIASFPNTINQSHSRYDSHEMHLPEAEEGFPTEPMGRFPRPVKRPTIERTTQEAPGLITEGEDYTSGPTLAMAKASLGLFGPLGVDSIFQDYGYRLLRDFHKIFDSSVPIQTKEHFMPVGLDHSSPLPEVMPWSVPPDSIIAGASELLDLAGQASSNRMLVTGVSKRHPLRPGAEQVNYITLNLEKDGVVPTRLEKSVDIDSMIWVTQIPSFSASVSIYSAPVSRNVPPIHKHNHVTVEVLLPRTGVPSSKWNFQDVSLSKIPHILFGHINNSCQILLFFPRMIHRKVSGFDANSVPHAMQVEFWTQVVIPAIRVSVNPADRPYTGLSLEHVFFKNQTPGGRGTRLSSTSHSCGVFSSVVQEMKHIVSRSTCRLKFSESDI